jgi:hypothetical protein
MPNGNPEFDLEAMEGFFAPIAEVLTEFARSRNLLIDKYYHDEPSWSLCFNHPQGGQAKISILYKESDAAILVSMWWRDDYESFTRSVRRGNEKDCPRVPEQVRTLLERELEEVLSWRDGDWTKVVGGYENPWKRYTREEFESMTPDWPLPKPLK